MSIDSESEYYFDDQFAVPFDANLKNKDIYTGKRLDQSNIDGAGDKSQLIQSLSESCICSDIGSSFQEFPDVLDDLLEQTSIEKHLFSPSHSISDVESKISMNRSNNSNVQSFIKSHLSRDYRITYDDKSKSKTNDDSQNNMESSTVTWNQLKSGKNTSLLKHKSSMVTSSSSCHDIKENTEPKLMSWNVIKDKDESASTNLLNNTSKRSRSFVKGFALEVSNNSTVSRAKSEPRNSLKSITNLFEIYSRSKAMKDSSIILEVGNSAKKNFGAQFPPVSFGSSEQIKRLRSNSFENKIQYPGLGRLNVPKNTRLNEYRMLSSTLPDLSFLTKSTDKLTTNKKKSSGNRTNSKDSGLDSSLNEKAKYMKAYEPPTTNDLIIFDEESDDNQMTPYLSVPNFNTMDLLTGSPRIKKNLILDNSSSDNKSMDRSASEPNFDSDLSKNPSRNNQEIKLNKPKKSVSFSEKKLNTPLSPIKRYRSTFQLDYSNLVPQAIPRNLGLYGNESDMVSEFTLGIHMKSNENEISSDDIKYKTLVKNIIKAIQELVNSCKTDDSSYSEKIVQIIEPFYAICTDGILPYQRNNFSLKSRHRLWTIIETSCGTAIMYSDILRGAKKIPIANEKARFKSFVKLLISSKLICKWFKMLCTNEVLLKNNYSKESFLRQYRGKMKGLHADLETNFQFLDNSQLSTKCQDELLNSSTGAIHLKSVQSVKSLKKNNSTGHDLDRLGHGNTNTTTTTTRVGAIKSNIPQRNLGGVSNTRNTSYLYKPSSNSSINKMKK